jgi:hypothetical protein
MADATCVIEPDSHREIRRIPRSTDGTSVAESAAIRLVMDHKSPSASAGFDRLQQLLLAMHIGDELRPSDASDETGLSPEVCLAVLLGLERAGLMSRGDQDRFVRRTLEFQ